MDGDALVGRAAAAVAAHLQGDLGTRDEIVQNLGRSQTESAQLAPKAFVFLAGSVLHLLARNLNTAPALVLDELPYPEFEPPINPAGIKMKPAIWRRALKLVLSVHDNSPDIDRFAATLNEQNVTPATSSAALALIIKLGESLQIPPDQIAIGFAETQVIGKPVEFDELTESERVVWDAAKTGGMADFSAGDWQSDQVTRGLEWGTERQIRARVVAALLTRQAPDRAAAVKIRGARITGILDLGAATLLCPLVLEACYFDAPITLQEAKAITIRLPGCIVPSILGEQLETQGNLELNNGFSSVNGVWLIAAHIGGMLDFNGAVLKGQGGLALIADSITVDQGVFFKEGFNADGEVRLIRAQVKGQVLFEGARLTNTNGPSFVADGISIGQDLIFRDGCNARGGIRLLRSHVGGQVAMQGARFEDRDRPALHADGLRVDHDISCPDGLIVRGEMRLNSATVGGTLDLSGADLENEGGLALGADRISVAESMFCRDGFTAVGQVRMINARIGGQLDFDGARISDPERARRRRRLRRPRLVLQERIRSTRADRSNKSSGRCTTKLLWGVFGCARYDGTRP